MKPAVLKHLPAMLRAIERQARKWKRPIVGTFAQGPYALFQILVSTVLSLRTKDDVTEKASLRLFKLARTPEELLKLDVHRIERTIFPVGFYRTKAGQLIRICRLLIERHRGEVPRTMEELLALPGVGRKTANLVLTVGHGLPGICVDTHVHRISNRWGLVRTKTPEETEERLRKVLPRKYWIGFNDLLVSYGQNLCQPVSPHCSRCPIAKHCPRIGVARSR